MPQPLPALLRRAQDALSGLQVTSAEVESAVPLLLADIIAHPALAPALAEPPASERATPPLSVVVPARVICEVANGDKPCFRDGGEWQWYTNCIAVQRLAFLAHGYNLAWFGEPLVDEEFDLFSGGPALASLRDLPGWKYCAENVPEVLLADTSRVTAHQRAVVKFIIDAHYTHGMSLDARVAKFPVVIDGDLSQGAIHAYFLSLVSDKEQTALKNRTGTSSRADAIESMIDADTRSERMRHWLSEG